MGKIDIRKGEPAKETVNESIIKFNFSNCCSKKGNCKIINGECDKYIERDLQDKLLTFLADNSATCQFCFFDKFSEFSLLAHQTFQQIKNPPYHDHELKRLYIEAKMQEWQVHLKASLKDYNDEKSIRSDCQLIIDVQRFLLKNIKNTPSLVQLAHRFGTNEKKLNEQFKQVSNMTVFSWLREQRMQKAVSLLQTRECSIKQISRDCGFKHQSDFTTSFKKKFQLTPMAFRKNVA